ncbi:MAG: serine hydrolase, partial [Methyloceanibacter sp.]
MRPTTPAKFVLKAAIALAVVSTLWSASARADALLDEMVEFTGQVFILDTKVPAVVIGALRDGEIAVRGFGERAGPGSPPPAGDTILRIGSITKVFTGDVLAHLVANGTVGLADPLTKWQPDFGPGVNGDVARVTLLDLATQSGGFPREVPHEPGPANDPFSTITRDAFANWTKTEPLLFAPGSSILYSNFGFDVLAMAMSAAAKKPYPDLLKEHITGPLDMKDTGF